jgi:hypothetical protein
MGKLVPLARSRSSAAPAREEFRTTTPGHDLDIELLPVAALLFVASVARVLRALWCHEQFDTEPTLALVFVIGLPWIAFRWRVKRD